jgi:hypothetical protein
MSQPVTHALSISLFLSFSLSLSLSLFIPFTISSHKRGGRHLAPRVEIFRSPGLFAEILKARGPGLHVAVRGSVRALILRFLIMSPS